MNLDFKNLLGLSRRAGKISWGHDAALNAIIFNKAKLCIVCSDASERLKKEFERACSYNDRNLTLLNLESTMDEMKSAIGVKAAVITVNDEGFVKMLMKVNEKCIREV